MTQRHSGSETAVANAFVLDVPGEVLQEKQGYVRILMKPEDLDELRQAVGEI